MAICVRLNRVSGGCGLVHMKLIHAVVILGVRSDALAVLRSFTNLSVV